MQMKGEGLQQGTEGVREQVSVLLLSGDRSPTHARFCRSGVLEGGSWSISWSPVVELGAGR